MAEVPRAGWPAHAALAHHHRGPADALPSPPPTTPDPGKSHASFARAVTEGLDAAGRRLGAVMPRYGFDAAELEALFAYL